MNERIRALRHTLQLSQKEFARQIGLKQNAISYMERPGATVTEQNIRAICAQFGVREDWLRFGSGEMFREGEREQRELLEIFDALRPALQEYLLRAAGELLRAKERSGRGRKIKRGLKNPLDKTIHFRYTTIENKEG